MERLREPDATARRARNGIRALKPPQCHTIRHAHSTGYRADGFVGLCATADFQIEERKCETSPCGFDRPGGAAFRTAQGRTQRYIPQAGPAAISHIFRRHIARYGRRHPLELDAMLEVSGVGEAKAAKVWPTFPSGYTQVRRPRRGHTQGNEREESLILFNAGMSIAEIAEAKGLKVATIQKSFRRTYRQRTRYLFPQTHQRRRIQSDIISALSSHPESAYDELKQRYASGLIAIAKAIYRATSVNGK